MEKNWIDDKGFDSYPDGWIDPKDGDIGRDFGG